MTRWAPVAFSALLLAGCAATPFRVMPMHGAQESLLEPPSESARTIAHFGEAEQYAARRGAFNRLLTDAIDLVTLVRFVTGNFPGRPAASPGLPDIVLPASAESLLDLTDDALRLRADDASLHLARAHFLEVLGRHHTAAAARDRAANLSRPPPPTIEP